MGKKPLAGALGLLWVGLAFTCASGVGCSSGGPTRPLTKGSIRENPNVRPPASIHTQSSGNDLNKLPPLPPANPLPPAISTDSKFGAGTTGKSPNRPSTIQQTSATTTSGTGGFDKGPKVDSSALPGSTNDVTKPLSNLDGLGGQPGSGLLPPVPPAGMSTQTTNFGADPLSNPARPIASGGSILPPPPLPGRDPIGGGTTPGSIPGAPTPPGAPFPDSQPIPPGASMPGTPVGTTSGYPPLGQPTTTTTAPPTAPITPGGYTAPGALPGDPLPAIGAGRNP